MLKYLSDHRTRALKIGPFLAIGVIVLFVTIMRRLIAIQPPPPPVPEPIDFDEPLLRAVGGSLAVFIWGSILFAAWKIKSVIIDGTMLTIGGLRRSIAIPLHQVAEVHQPWWTGRLARIELHGESEFGDSIWFLPTGGAESLLAPSRAVLELRAMVAGRRGDRSILPPPPVDFARAWRRYRRLWTIHLLSPVAVFAAMILMEWTKPGWPYAIPVSMALGLPWLITGNLLRHWHCPQCGQRFFHPMWGILIPTMFIRQCYSCGLPKGQLHPSLPAQPGR